MNAMSYKGYAARVEFDGEDRIFVGHVAGINDVVGFHGESVTQLEAAFHEAVDDYLATCAKVGKAPERSYSGAFMVRLAPEEHQRVALAAELEGMSLNRWAADALVAAAGRSRGVGQAMPVRLAGSGQAQPKKLKLRIAKTPAGKGAAMKKLASKPARTQGTVRSPAPRRDTPRKAN
jgi:predicted HicB family RNase H-like nuclease